MTAFQIKQGDTLPKLRMTLADASGALSLIGADVQFRMRARGGSTLLLDVPADVVDAAAGIVEHEWLDGETDAAGVFLIELAVTYVDGRQTVPTNGFIEVRVLPRLINP